MFDHVGLNVEDFEATLTLYRNALEPLGYCVESEDAKAGAAGLGRKSAPKLWLNRSKRATRGAHLAFTAPDRAAVRAFHAAALKAGAQDNGKPGIRESYGPDYYAAFVLDLAGNNIEAVCLAKA